jgi:tetratricopeptide (TPR) repeat protein
MIRSRRLLVGIAATLAFTLRASIAQAQLETFAQAVRDLAGASRQAEPSRSAGIHAAADRLGPALAEWDRRIAALKVQSDGELAAAPAAERAYRLHVELGVAYRARGRAADALREFDAAARSRPSSDLQMLRALTLESDGRLDEAGKAFLAAFALDSGSAVKAYYAAERGDGPAEGRERARAALAAMYRDLKIEAAPTAAPPFVTLSAIQDNLSRTPVIADNATARAFALLRDEKYDDAVAAFGRAAAGNNDKSDDSPLAHFARGQRDEAINHVAEARREYQAAANGALVGRSVLFVAIARLAQVEGDAAGAIDAFVQAARLNPNDPNVHKELAAAYATEGRADETFCELMAALLIDRRDAQAHASIGQLYVDTGRNADAVAAFDRALALRPEGYEVRYALATAYTRLGNTVEAARQLEIYDRLRRDALEKRRRDIASEVEQEERRRAK